MPAKEDLKEAVIKTLTPIFGDDIKKTIVQYYDSTHPEELLDLAHKMLAGYLGEQRAENILKDLRSKTSKAVTK